MADKEAAEVKCACTPLRWSLRVLIIAAVGAVAVVCGSLLLHQRAGREGADKEAPAGPVASAPGGLLLGEDLARHPDSGDGWFGTPRPRPGNYARPTPEYVRWRADFVKALARLDRAKQHGKATALRKWFHRFEPALQRWTLEGGRRPSVSLLFLTPAVRRLVCAPPHGAFEKFYGYKIVLPLDRHVFYYPAGPVEASRYLLHPDGVRYGGRRAKDQADVFSLFREAGVTSPVARNVLLKVSGREGGFEAVNTWDTGYVSVGFIQFTTGPTSEGRSLVRVLERMQESEERKTKMNPARRNEFDYYFVKRGVCVEDGKLVVRDPATAKFLKGADAVNAIIEDKRLIAVFQNAGEHSRAFRVAQIQEAYRSYYLADKFWRLPVAVVETYVDGSEEPRKSYVYGARNVQLAMAQATRRGELPERGDTPARRVVTRLPDIVASYSDALPSEGGMLTLTDRAVQRGVLNACQSFEAAVIEVAGDGPLVMKDFRRREKDLIARIRNRIDVLPQVPAAALAPMGGKRKSPAVLEPERPVEQAAGPAAAAFVNAAGEPAAPQPIDELGEKHNETTVPDAR